MRIMIYWGLFWGCPIEGNSRFRSKGLGFSIWDQPCIERLSLHVFICANVQVCSGCPFGVTPQDLPCMSHGTGYNDL